MLVCKFLNLNNIDDKTEQQRILASFRRGEFLFSTPLRMQSKNTGRNTDMQDGLVTIPAHTFFQESGCLKPINSGEKDLSEIFTSDEYTVVANISDLLIFCTTKILDTNIYIRKNGKEDKLTVGKTKLWESTGETIIRNFFEQFKNDPFYKINKNETYKNIYFTIFDLDVLIDSIIDNTDEYIFYAVLKMNYEDFDNEEMLLEKIENIISSLTPVHLQNLEGYFGDGLYLRLFLKQYLKEKKYQYEDEIRLTIANWISDDYFMKQNEEGDYLLKPSVLEDKYCAFSELSIEEYLKQSDPKLIVDTFGNACDYLTCPHISHTGNVSNCRNEVLPFIGPDSELKIKGSKRRY